MVKVHLKVHPIEKRLFVASTEKTVLFKIFRNEKNLLRRFYAFVLVLTVKSFQTRLDEISLLVLRIYRRLPKFWRLMTRLSFSSL